MPLNLRLAGWPPVASHIASLLFGVSLAHLSWEDSPASLQLPNQALVMSLAPALLKPPENGGLQRGMRVHLVHSPAGLLTCRLSKEPFLLLETMPAPVVSAGINAHTDFTTAAQAAAAGELSLRGAKSAVSLPYCAAKPKVIYGAS